MTDPLEHLTDAKESLGTAHHVADLTDDQEFRLLKAAALIDDLEGEVAELREKRLTA